VHLVVVQRDKFPRLFSNISHALLSNIFAVQTQLLNKEATRLSLEVKITWWDAENTGLTILRRLIQNSYIKKLLLLRKLVRINNPVLKACYGMYSHSVEFTLMCYSFDI